MLKDPGHVGEELTLEIHANRVKFGINQLMVFLQECPSCKDNVVSYEVETMPVYRIEKEDNEVGDNIKFKIIFSDYVVNLTDNIGSTFAVDVQQSPDNPVNASVVGQGTGNLIGSTALSNAYIKDEREIIGERPVFQDQNNWGYSVFP